MMKQALILAHICFYIIGLLWAFSLLELNCNRPLILVRTAFVANQKLRNLTNLRKKYCQ